MKFKIVQYLILKLKTNPTLHLQNSIKKKKKLEFYTTNIH